MALLPAVYLLLLLFFKYNPVWASITLSQKKNSRPKIQLPFSFTCSLLVLVRFNVGLFLLKPCH